MTTTDPIPLRVDIVSDVVCPWCIIGYLQFKTALDSLPGVFSLALNWHPFELNPHMPPQGQEIREHVAEKYGATAEQSRGSRQRLVEFGESLGFTFDYFEGMRIVNTFAAHQLLHWARLQSPDKQTALKLKLFEDYFTHGRDVSDLNVLVSSAVKIGLPEDEARTVLNKAVYASAVRSEQKVWVDQDVHAVPTFFFEGTFPVPGAQDAATFARILEKIREKKVAA